MGRAGSGKFVCCSHKEAEKTLLDREKRIRYAIDIQYVRLVIDNQCLVVDGICFGRRSALVGVMIECREIDGDSRTFAG